MNNETVSTSAAATDKPQRLPYTSPSLKVYGQLRDLTDGGSGAVLEGAMMTAINRMA
jgi:hypothetical protein